MPRELEILCNVNEDGTLPKSRTEQIRGHLKLFGGGQVRIRIGKPKRSNKANRYYWGGVIRQVHEAMMDAGIAFMETNDGIKSVSAGILHEVFKQRHLPVRVIMIDDEEFVLPPSTANLDSTEFSDYIEAIKMDPMVRKLSIHFEEPGEEWRSYSIEEIGF